MKINQYLTAKTKFRLLVVAIVLFIPVLYYYGINNTLVEKASRDRALENIALSTKAPEKINNMKSQLASYGQKMNQYMVDTISGGDPLLHLVSGYCNQNKTELHKVEQVNVAEKGGYNIETLPVIVRGGFKPMLGLIYHLEQIEKKGRIASVSFVRMNDPKIRREVLELKIYLQTIHANE